jgi:hypothetical protein
MFSKLFIKHSQIFVITKSLKSRVNSCVCSETTLGCHLSAGCKINIYGLWHLLRVNCDALGSLQIHVADDILHPPFCSIIKIQEMRRQRD